MNNQTVNNRIWIFVVGPEKIGKTEIISHFLSLKSIKSSSYSVTTYNEIITLCDRNIMVSILDSSYNSESFKFFMRLSNSAIMYFYDVTDIKSFNRIKQIYFEYHKDENEEEILVGNTKSNENKREISYKEGLRFAISNNMNFFEVSSVTGENVSECFYSSIRQAIESNKESKISLLKEISKVQSKKICGCIIY